MTYIIAEVGSNFRNFDDCLFSIAKAAECGVDAVKFQLASDVELYGFEVDCENFNNTFIKREWCSPLSEHCKSVGVDFMCSAFSVDGYKFLEENNLVKNHKIASAENNHTGILEYLAKKSKRPVFVSCGHSTKEDISRIIGFLPTNRLILLYCVTDYFQSESVGKLGSVSFFKEYSALTLGYSSNVKSNVDLSLSLKVADLKVVEKHFNAFSGEISTPDSAHSLVPYEMEMLVCKLRSKDDVSVYGYSDGFQWMHKRRVVAVRDIKKGDEFLLDKRSLADRGHDQRSGNIGIYRIAARESFLPAKTRMISPHYFPMLNGRFSKNDYEKGDQISSEELI